MLKRFLGTANACVIKKSYGNLLRTVVKCSIYKDNTRQPTGRGNNVSILMSIFLGIVQGITEFLPVSSSGHLSILQNLLKLDYSDAEHLLFEVLLHLATLVSVVVVYRTELRGMVKETAAFLRGHGEEGAGGEDGRFTPSVRLVFLIVVATLPLLLVVPFSEKVEMLFAKTGFIGFALLATGTLLFVADKLSAGRKNERTATVVDVLVVGLAQAVAVLPGLSRSGTTITVGMARGLKRDFAMKFSFLLSIPAIIGSVLLELIKAFSAGVTWSLLPIYLVGMVFAGVTGYFALRFLKVIINKALFGKMSYYCWGVGVLTLILSIFIH